MVMCSLAAIVIAASTAVAQAEGPPARNQPLVAKELSELGVLVGDWAGSGTIDQQPFAFYSSCKWVLAGRFLELSLTVLDARKNVTSTRRQLVGWDADKRKLTAWTFYSDGSYVRATGSHRDGKITFEGCEITSGGKKKQHEGAVTIVGRDKWNFQIVIRTDGTEDPVVCRGRAERVEQLPDLPREDGGTPRKELKSLEPEIRKWTAWTRTQTWRANYRWTLRHTILQVDTPLGKDTAQMLIGWNAEKSRAAYWWFDSTGNAVGPAVAWHVLAR